MSLPNSSGIMPAAKAAAAPPEEPPDVISRFHGLRVVPKSGLSHWKSQAIVDKLDLPAIVTPARLNRDTLGASEFGRKFAMGGKPDVAANPSTAMLSFTVIGMPSSGPRTAFAARLSSLSLAVFRAASTSIATMALTVGLTASIRSTVAINNSSALSSFLLSAEESCCAVEKGPIWTFPCTLIGIPPFLPVYDKTRCPHIYSRATENFSDTCSGPKDVRCHSAMQESRARPT